MHSCWTGCRCWAKQKSTSRVVGIIWNASLLRNPKRQSIPTAGPLRMAPWKWTRRVHHLETQVSMTARPRQLLLWCLWWICNWNANKYSGQNECIFLFQCVPATMGPPALFICQWNASKYCAQNKCMCMFQVCRYRRSRGHEEPSQHTSTKSAWRREDSHRRLSSIPAPARVTRVRQDMLVEWSLWHASTVPVPLVREKSWSLW